MPDKWAKAQERKQKEVQEKTLAQLKKQVEDLKKEIAEGKRPLRTKIEQLEVKIDELEKEKIQSDIKHYSAKRENAGYVKEIERLCKELAEFHQKEKANVSDSVKVADAQ